MYEGLRTNNPKEVMELPELPMSLKQDDPKIGSTSYPYRSYMLEYLEEFARKFGIEKYIKFNSWIQNVTFDESVKKFNVSVKDLKTKQEREEVFDYVIVATGHFSCPNYVTYPGQETFKGTVVHSKQFVDEARYKGQSQFGLVLFIFTA